MEKYLTMARDAAAAGDRIAAENYYQHAEHYFRTLNASGGNGTGERHHQHMNTPSDPTGGDDYDGDDDMPGNRPYAPEPRHMQEPRHTQEPRHMQDQRPVNNQNANAVRPAEQPRIDPSHVEQPRTDMPATPENGAPQPYEARGDQDQRRRGPNGRRRHGMDGQGPRQGGNSQGGQAAPQRDPRSISPASPAEAASTENDPTDSEKPSDA